MPAAFGGHSFSDEEPPMSDKPEFPADVPTTPPTPGKTQPIPPEMPPAQIPTPEIMPTPAPHPAGPGGTVA
jgi:hypothetical protein